MGQEVKEGRNGRVRGMVLLHLRLGLGGGALGAGAACTHLSQPKVFKRWDFEPAQVQLVVVAGVHARRGAGQHLSRKSRHRI